MLVRGATLLGFCILLAGELQAAPAGQSAHAVIAVDGPAYLRSWQPPVYPAKALRNRIEGRVLVRLVIDDAGTVVSANILSAIDPELGVAALDTVRKWQFTPALDAGVPVSCSMDAPVVFSLKNPAGQSRIPGMPPNGAIPQLSPTAAARPINTPTVDYPDVLFDRRLPGRVLYSCDVLANGHTANLYIKSSTHVDFVQPALYMLRQSEFSPALQGELPIKSRIEGRITFDAISGSAPNIFTANMISDSYGNLPSADITLVKVVDPVFPLDLLLKGISGSATVSYTLSQSGMPQELRVVEATDPEFGAALAAAVEMCEFSTASTSGHPLIGPLETAERLKQRADFHAIDLTNENDSNPVTRLFAAIRENTIADARNLDAKLAPLYQVEPVYPDSVDRKVLPEGNAEVEIIIDRTGRARLPRIISATTSDFGWSAATAVSQWVFDVPKRGGQPVDVKLSIPFHFDAPDESQKIYHHPTIEDRHP